MEQNELFPAHSKRLGGVEFIMGSRSCKSRSLLKCSGLKVQIGKESSSDIALSASRPEVWAVSG